MNKILLLLITLTSISPAFADDSKPETFAARTLELVVPDGWKSKKPSSSMRVAEFSVEGDPSAANVVVFYFGGPTGGVKANVERWIGQFEKEGLKLEMFQGKCTAGSYILVDCAGTWNKPDGPPFARKTIATPNSRVINVIVVEEDGDKTDYYFMKLSGHADVVSKQTEKIRSAIGAKADSEKPFELK